MLALVPFAPGAAALARRRSRPEMAAVARALSVATRALRAQPQASHVSDAESASMCVMRVVRAETARRLAHRPAQHSAARLLSLLRCCVAPRAWLAGCALFAGTQSVLAGAMRRQALQKSWCVPHAIRRLLCVPRPPMHWRAESERRSRWRARSPAVRVMPFACS